MSQTEIPQEAKPDGPVYVMEYRGYRLWRQRDGSFMAYRSTGKEERRRDPNDKKAGKKLVDGTENAFKTITLRKADSGPITDAEALEMIDVKLKPKRTPKMEMPPELGLDFGEPNVPSQSQGWNPNGE